VKQKRNERESVSGGPVQLVTNNASALCHAPSVDEDGDVTAPR